MTASISKTALALLLVVLQVPDIRTTNRILALGGRELNPAVRLLMRLGPRWWWPKLVLAGVAAYWLAASSDPEAVWLLGLVDLAYLGVVLSNLRQMKRLERRARP
ncbi:hypothetical protein dsx2_1769 [Desulfovibrio sp. X2]|uniref:DUF5658 family protein n=1 Tax=Desulfovibrio sp. X2 TaxID=941449 RepID=UPI0003588F11|nr:DUF5658 family protein [Desulfovibrio sp. X2]EPR44408.1 hypothetical protein dsx2_1769 [Desulfovibrio sp. X2]